MPEQRTCLKNSFAQPSSTDGWCCWQSSVWLPSACSTYQKLPIDAVPDITNVQVQINTQAPGYSPLETEQRVTYPIETVMAGLAQPGGKPALFRATASRK